MDILSINLGAKKALEKLGVKTEKVQTTVFQGSLISDGGSSNYTIDFIPVADKEYTVTVNGETSTQKATAYTIEDLGDVILVGNHIIAGGDANGVEWMAMYIPDLGVTMFAWVDDREMDGTTVSITTETETIHPIDPKFIPGAEVLDFDKYVDLNSLFVAGGGKKSADLSELFAKIVEGKSYVIKATFVDTIDGSNTTIYVNPVYIQWRSDGTVQSIGATITGVIGSNAVTGNFCFYSSNTYCTFTSVAIPT